MPTIYDNPMFSLQNQGGPAPQPINPNNINTFSGTPNGNAFGTTPPTNTNVTAPPDTNNINTFTGTPNGNAFAPVTTAPTTNTFGPNGPFGSPTTGSGYGYISPRDKVASGMMNYGYRRFAPHGMFGGI